MDYKEKVIALLKSQELSKEQKEKLEGIFPELKESEDEKIRQKLIKLVKMSSEVGGFALHKWEADEMLAWLEKQGEKESITCPICGWELEKQGEQKPVDKVEPKFHEGEWLCENEPNNYARFIQILEIVNVQGKDRYRISRDIHKDEDVVEFGFVEKYYNKFDIQDAKDGDVLHCWIDGYEFILIFNCIKDGYVNAFCHLYNNLNSFSEEPTTMFCRTIQGHFTPATKEQRDTLIKVMTDAGYTFDFEKKELKIIDFSKHLKYNPDTPSITEHKPAWSEEDDDCLSTIIAEFSKCAGKSVSKDEWMRCNDWLNSLKDRVQPQPKQEWREEDEERL